MMSAPKLVSPPPPPTSNTLTQTQRTRLMRTTKKLSHVLGSTPQLLDTASPRSSTPVDDDWSEDEEDWYRPASRGSNRSTTSGVSSSSGSTASSSLISRSMSITRSRRSSSLSEDSSNSTKPPLLRLALASFSRQSSSAANKCYPSPSSTNSSDDEDGRFTLQTTFTESPRDSLVSPEFRIPSSTTLRLQKMDRIRKKLGDGVPVKLVFPESDEEEEPRQPSHSKHSKSHTVVQLTTLPALPPVPPTPRPRPSKARHPGHRDSIVSSSAHRGQRVKRKPVPTLEQLTQSAPSSPARSSSKRAKARLSLILETPQDLELYFAPVIESGSSTSSSSPASEWFDDETEQWVDYKTFIRMAQDS